MPLNESNKQDNRPWMSSIRSSCQSSFTTGNTLYIRRISSVDNRDIGKDTYCQGPMRDDVICVCVCVCVHACVADQSSGRYIGLFVIYISVHIGTYFLRAGYQG